MKNLKNRIFKHWESTLCGLILLSFLSLYLLKKIDTEKMITAVTVVVSVYSILSRNGSSKQSKDGNYYE